MKSMEVDQHRSSIGPLGLFFSGLILLGVAAAGAAVIPRDCPVCEPLYERIVGEDSVLPMELSCRYCADGRRVPLYRKKLLPPTKEMQWLSNPWLRAFQSYGQRDPTKIAVAPNRTLEDTRRAVPVLIQAVRTGDREAVCAGALGLRLMGPEAREALPALIDLLRSGDPRHRRGAARALGNIKASPERVAPLLMDLLREEDFFARWDAVSALCELGYLSDAVASALLGRLTDPVRHVRRSAAWALGELKVQAAIPALRLMAESDLEEADAARDALNRFSSGTR